MNDVPIAQTDDNADALFDVQHYLLIILSLLGQGVGHII